MSVSLTERRQQNLSAARPDTRSVTPSTRSFAQAIDRQRAAVERIPLLSLARPEVAKVASALDSAEVAALAVEVDHPAADLPRMAELARLISVPLLRMDLLLEEFQIYESRLYGADAVLLVAAQLPDGALARLCNAARSTHLTACVLCATAADVARAAGSRADVIALAPAALLDQALVAAVPARALVLVVPAAADADAVAATLLGRADALIDRAIAFAADPAAAFCAALAEEE